MKPQWKPLPIPFLAVLGLAVFSVGTPGATPQEDQDQESGGRFTVNVETIVVNVLVTDRNGKPLTGLQKENFRIFEDGEEQVVQNFFPVDAPFSVGLLLDTSYSTVGKLARGESRPHLVERVARAFRTNVRKAKNRGAYRLLDLLNVHADHGTGDNESARKCREFLLRFFLELPTDVHPYFIGGQFHPELTSRPLRPSPMFTGLVAAASKLSKTGG